MPLSEAADRLSTLDLLEILQAPDWQQLRECMQHLLPKLDVCDFMLKMDIMSVSGGPLVQIFGSLPSAMFKLLRHSTDEKIDPIQQHLSRSSLPLTWQVEQLCALHGGQIYLLLKTMGITHGMSLAIHSQHAVSRLDFYSNGQKRSPLSTSGQADALLLGIYLQDAAELMWRKGAPGQEPLLSARELECLRWSADGKTSSEIGLILGISQRTVYFHLKNVAMKLGVYSTRHAISKAVMMGIIKPNS